MAGETHLTVVGNLVNDPELRYTASGVGVCSFTVASTPRTFNKGTNSWEDGESLFMRCTAWRQMGENVAESLVKGNRVVVTGALFQRSYETREGEKRTVMELRADEVAPSLKYATAKVNRVSRNEGGNQDWGGGQQRQAPANEDPWSNPPPTTGRGFGGGGFSEEPPFAVSPRMWDLNV